MWMYFTDKAWERAVGKSLGRGRSFAWMAPNYTIHSPRLLTPGWLQRRYSTTNNRPTVTVLTIAEAPRIDYCRTLDIHFFCELDARTLSMPKPNRGHRPTRGSKPHYNTPEPNSSKFQLYLYVPRTKARSSSRWL